ncbi:MAG: NAD-dependent epimerase/dehydratase family protein [Promethearchaeota archaeon]
MVKNILVTGANGFIGSHLVEHLLKNDENKVRGMVLKGTDESNLDDARASPNFNIIHADLLDLESLNIACKDIDVIYHLAALVSDWGPKALFRKIILDGTKNLVQAALNNSVKRMIYMSSLVVHGLGGHVQANENAPFDPVPFFPYAIAKTETEKFLIDVNDNTSLEIVRIRPGFDIIGPRNFTSTFKIFENIEKGKFGFINGGKSLITLVFVKNLVAGMAHVANLKDAAGEAYIIGDVSWTWKRYVEEIAARLDVKPPRLNVNYWGIAGLVWFIEFWAKLLRLKNPPVLTRYRIAVPRNDIDFVSDKIISTGFKAPFTFDQGLDITIDWYKEIKKELKKN